MKKILLIVAVAVCVAVAGTALALTTFNSAQDVTGTLTADTYLSLDWGNSVSTVANLELEAGVPQVYTIDYTVAKSTSAPAGALTITLSPANSKTFEGVTVRLFSDSSCTTLLTGVNQLAGAATETTLTISNLTQNGTIYAQFSLSDEATAANILGSMTLSLDAAA